MKMISVQIGSQANSSSGYVLKTADLFWVHIHGETFAIEVTELSGHVRRRSAKRATKGEGLGEIVAPMPGKIIKVMVNVGDTVEKSKVLIVMEAMKMEYTLKAPIAGIVRRIGCTCGQQVALGEVLVSLRRVGE